MNDQKKFPRDSAGYIDLNGGTGPITGMYPAGPFMEVFKIDKTFRVHTPEALDPERKDPNMSFVVTPIENVGSGNPIVARVFIQASEALKSAILRKEINKEQVVILSHACKELLLSCEKARLEFNQKFEAIKKQIDEGIKKERNVIPAFPLIDNLDSITTIFLTNAKRFIETETKIVNEFFQTSFNGPRFDIIASWAKNKFGQNKFIEFLEETNDNLKLIIDLRNFQEHPKKDKKTHINNFRLLPHNQIGIPTWNVTGSEERYIGVDMQGIVNFLIEFSETLFFNCVMLNLVTNFPYKVTFVEEEKRDVNCPIKYKLEIDQDIFFGKSNSPSK